MLQSLSLHMQRLTTRGAVLSALPTLSSLSRQSLSSLQQTPSLQHTSIRGVKTKSARELEAEKAGLIRRFKPTTPGRRHLVLIRQPDLWQGKPVRELVRGLRKTGGRSHGRVTVRHIGGGHKRNYRFVDFKRSRVLNLPATVMRLEYDPNRNAHIALVQYPNAVLSYILAPEYLKEGDVVMSSRDKELDLKPGNCMPLKFIPLGAVVHNVELHPGHGGQIARAAGTSVTVIDKASKPGFVLLEMVSKEQRYVRLDCMATVGSVSNPLANLVKLGKAGRSRWLGIRPTVRGMAMNPIDHPMGGGHAGKGRHPCSPTGVLSKGFKTRRNKNYNRLIAKRRPPGIRAAAGGKIDTL